MPQLIEALQQVGNPDETLKRMLGLFEAVAGRNVYLSLLAENPDALAQLLRLSSASPWICDYLSRYPVLFDELLDTQMKICRGSGVLIKQGDQWKVQHYVLSMTMPNEQIKAAVKIKAPIEDELIKKLSHH